VIEEYVAARGITLLLHFTQVCNLDSILQRGILPRNMLIGEDGVRFNDQYRFDGTDAVCLSISYPNYKMFFRLRQESPDAEWVVLAVRPRALWMLPCAFCGNECSFRYYYCDTIGAASDSRSVTGFICRLGR
jgi:hypothetical protein